MRAIRIHGRDDMRVDVPAPEAASGQVRLRMAWAGVCGSDLHYFDEGGNRAFTVRGPLVPGHEVAGGVADRRVLVSGSRPIGLLATARDSEASGKVLVRLCGAAS